MTTLRQLRRSRVWRSVGLTTAAAVLGNVVVRPDDLRWFAGLQHPRRQLPLRGFLLVGALYYLSIGTVLHRSIVRRDKATYRLALVVLTGNEVWNAFFFGRHSTRAGFLGVLAFAVPVCRLQIAVARDHPSVLAFSPYTAWVVGYDIPWTYRLWRLNP
jgi:tryptophan-rich sensory protein